MFFLLGVLFAGLLGLMVLPALWRRAVRLSTRRLEMQVPLSMEEVLAERDLLRAEFAVAERRIEDRLTMAREQLARVRGELGQKTAALLIRNDEAAALRAELARVERALADQAALATDLQAQLGAAMKEVWDASVAREQTHAAQEEAQKLKRLAGERQMTIAGLEARLATLELRERDLLRDLGERDKLLTGRHALIERITEERDRARGEIQSYADKQASLRATLDARERRISELDDLGATLERKIAGLERDLRTARRGAGRPEPGDGNLRASIAELGEEVLRIAAALEVEAAPPKPRRAKRSAKTAADKLAS